MVSVLVNPEPAGALALDFAVLAPFGLVLEVLVVEEVLFSRCKYEICSAINALENAILKLRHSNCAPLSPELELDVISGGTALAIRRPPPSFIRLPGDSFSGFVCGPAPA